MATTIENLPMEVLEEILRNLDLKELSEVAWKVEDRWFQAVHNIISRGFCDYGPVILHKLDDVKNQLLLPQPDLKFEDHELILVAEYSFLQILNSEYKIIYSIFWDHSMNSNNTELICQAGVCLKEFKKLLNASTKGLWNWKAENITTALDDLRGMNARFIHHFFCHIWNPNEERIGPLLIGLLDCSLHSHYFVRVSHDENQVFKDAPCHICGHYEIQDSGNTLRTLSPDLWKQPSNKSIRILVCNLCDAIRWGNLFYMLKLRWASMDNALANNRRREKMLDYLNQFINDVSSQKTESAEATNGSAKITKTLKRNPTSNAQSTRQGIRCEFQLWCTLPQAPTCLLGRQYRLSLDSLPVSEASTTCTRPYHFKMELKTSVGQVDSVLVENIIWLEETAFNIIIKQNKETVASTQA